MRPTSATVWVPALLGSLSGVSALQLDLKSDDSIKDTAGTIAYGLMKYYTGNETGDVPGNLPAPYYWWEAGAMFGTMLDYWYYTGDDTYNDVTMQAMLHQQTDKGDFQPANQTASMGNDDQGFWGITAMMAAENVFPNPPSDKPQWLACVQAIFNEYVARWQKEVNDGYCGGGLRWQVYSFNGGYDYKNSVANGCFFNIAARLARFTGNDTYGEWASKIWDWQVKHDIITSDYQVKDGIEVDDTAKTCQNIHPIEFSYNNGLFLQGAAYMYNHTKDDRWKTRTDGLLNQTQQRFLNDSIIFEPACEPYGTCAVNELNMLSFKGYLLRFMTATTKVAPWTYDTVMKMMSDTAQAAVKVCNAKQGTEFRGLIFRGEDGSGCRFDWVPGSKDRGQVDVGSHMDALSAVMYNLAQKVEPPATSENRGTSKGDPNAGRPSDNALPNLRDITTADKAGAGILTAVVVGGIVVTSLWISLGKFERS